MPNTPNIDVQKAKHYYRIEGGMRIDEGSLIKLLSSIQKIDLLEVGIYQNHFASDHSPKELEDYFANLFRKISIGSQDQHTVLKKAQQDIKKYPSKRVIFSPKPNENSFRYTARAIQEHRGLVIAEWHDERASKKFVIENMAAWKKVAETLNSILKLHLEHLLSDTMKLALKKYLHATGSRIPLVLLNYLLNLDIRFGLVDKDAQGDNVFNPYSFTGIVMQAKKLGVPIEAIDTEETYFFKVVCDDNGQDRIILMNDKAMKGVDRKNEIPIFFVGNHHANYYYQDIPGVAELYQCPSAFVRDLKNTDRYEILHEKLTDEEMKHQLLLKKLPPFKKASAKVIEIDPHTFVEIDASIRTEAAQLLCDEFAEMIKETIELYEKNVEPELLKYVQLGLIKNFSFKNTKKFDFMSPLHLAVQQNNVEVFKKLLPNIKDINFPDKQGWTVLHLAAQQGDIEIVRILLKIKGITINARTKQGETPLDLAIKYHHEEVKNLLLGKIPENNPDEKQLRRQQSLHQAVEQKIQSYNQPNTLKSSDLQEILFDALASKEHQGLDFVLKQKVNPLKETADGNNALLFILARNWNVSFWLEAYRKLTAKDELQKATTTQLFQIALTAGRYNHPEIYQELFDKGLLSLSTVDEDGYYLSYWAAIEENKDLLAYLDEKQKKSPLIIITDDVPPLISAVQSAVQTQNWNEVEKLLKDKEIAKNINKRDRIGKTALYYLIEHVITNERLCSPPPSRIKIMTLCNAGADVNAKDFYDETILHFLARFQEPVIEGFYKALSTILFKYNCNVDIRNIAGFSPREIAEENKNESFLKAFSKQIPSNSPAFFQAEQKNTMSPSLQVTKSATDSPSP